MYPGSFRHAHHQTIVLSDSQGYTIIYTENQMEFLKLFGFTQLYIF